MLFNIWRQLASVDFFCTRWHCYWRHKTNAKCPKWGISRPSWTEKSTPQSMEVKTNSTALQRHATKKHLQPQSANGTNVTLRNIQVRRFMTNSLSPVEKTHRATTFPIYEVLLMKQFWPHCTHCGFLRKAEHFALRVGVNYIFCVVNLYKKKATRTMFSAAGADAGPHNGAVKKLSMCYQCSFLSLLKSHGGQRTLVRVIGFCPCAPKPDCV